MEIKNQYPKDEAYFCITLKANNPINLDQKSFDYT